MDYLSAHVLEYISYILQISVVFTLKDILGLSIFVSVGNEERKYGALNVADFAIFSLLKEIQSYQSNLRGLFTTFPI